MKFVIVIFYYVSEFEKLKQLTLINIYESDEYKRLLCMDLPYFEFTMDYKNSIYEKLYINRIDWYYEIKENHLYPLSIYSDVSIKEEELVILSCMFKTAYSKIN